MSPELLKVVERAQREPEGRFHSLAHLMDVPALERAFHRLRKDAAVGVDGVTKEQYGEALGANLADLHERLKSKRYRHQALRRGRVPKGKGQWRPIGISVFEDKIVQDAVREVMEAVCEQDFLECSYGCRPERSAHDAVRALDRAVHRGKVSWILEADIASFFDSLDRTKLKERKLTSHIWSSTSRIPTIWPAKTWLRLIFRLPMQIRSQRVTRTARSWKGKLSLAKHNGLHAVPSGESPTWTCHHNRQVITDKLFVELTSGIYQNRRDGRD
jgi:hypothetical protein